MDEQQLRSEIDTAREIRFPSDILAQKKATLRDVYYPALNQEKILAVNSPDSKKEEHIQKILSTWNTIESLENEISGEDPEWVRPEGVIVDVSNSPLLISSVESAAMIYGTKGEFQEDLLVSGLPVSAQSWPVGSIFISVNDTNPNSLFGFGSWSIIAQGRMLVGVDPNDPDFNVSEKVGGEKEVILTEGQLPEHNHQQLPHTHTLTGGMKDENKTPFAGPDASDSLSTPFAGGVTSSVAENLPTGNGEPHNNLPPYFSVYIFKREA